MLFRHATGLGLRVLCLSVFMMGLMVADHHYRYVNNVRNVLSVVLIPLQYALNAPIQAIDWVKMSAATQHQLTTENIHLKQQILLMQVSLQQLINMQQENSQLRALLKSSSRINGQFQEAKLLAMNLEAASAEVVLDKGSRDGVEIGQVVIDVSGVMGQIMDVTPFTSRLLLITDPRSGVPVEDDRSNFQAIVMGTGANMPLSLIHVAETSDVKVGDLLLTSGLGARYPEGYPVGTVSRITKMSGEPFLSIAVEPSALLEQSRRVLIVSHYLNDDSKKMLYEATTVPMKPAVAGGTQ
ncbi:MAG: Rod shape-determining protein MreC [Gammaproteobacteria bacterium]|jgi:rod shape-determining protein MreC|nr:Rod shape-determining protein MreC [Gammaproteobacteria bacterium]